MAEEVVLSILRGPSELTALLSRREEARLSFTHRRVSLSQLVRFPAKPHLEKAWKHLAGARYADAETLFHTLVLLEETAPDLSAESFAEPLPKGWGQPLPPRGYKSVRAGQAKPPLPPKLDLRPYLCQPGPLRALLELLWPHFPEVHQRLRSLRYPDETLPSLLRPWNAPPTYAAFFWNRWQAGGLALFRDLSLEKKAPLCHAIAHLAALAPKQTALAWCEFLATLSSERRAILLAALFESRAWKLAPDPGLEELHTLARENSEFETWTTAYLHLASTGGDLAHYLNGVRLGAQFCRRAYFGGAFRCSDFPYATVEEIGRTIPNSGWLVISLWNGCGELPGLGTALRQSRWREFGAESARTYLSFLTSLRYSAPSKRALERKWQLLAAELPAIEEALLALPAKHRRPAALWLESWISHWSATGFRGRLSNALALLAHYAARGAFPEEYGYSQLLLPFLDLHGSAWKAFLAVPKESFDAILPACRRENDATLIARGLEPLVRFPGSFLTDAFRLAPGKLFRTAKTLGTVSHALAAEVLRILSKHPLFEVDPHVQTPAEAALAIAPHLNESLTNPIPARLTEWLWGEIDLTPARVERYRAVMADRLILTQLDLIEEAVFDRLKRDLPEAEDWDGHALRMLGWVDENRRGLRKFLKAWGSGNRKYLDDHPATIAWYTKHPKVNRELWENGIPWEASGLSIRMERDPFEVLKLGTYVGSCLSLGGGFSYSAVAALLDANKQVLYARDASGAVVARQLLALSDDDQLVCFWVYPRRVSAKIQIQFRDYDHAFAKALGLPIFEYQDDKPYFKVSPVLSTHWWDDGIWGFRIPKSKKETPAARAIRANSP